MTAELEAIYLLSTRIREYEAAADTIKCLARLATDVQVRSVLGTQALELLQTAGKWRLEQDQELTAQRDRGLALVHPPPPAASAPPPKPEPTPAELAAASHRAAESRRAVAAEVRRQVGACGTVFGTGTRCTLPPDHQGGHMAVYPPFRTEEEVPE